MSDNLKYWLERAKNVMDAESLVDAQAIIEIERIILLMYAEITKELLAFYAKYAKDTGLSIQEVKKMADSFDVQAFSNKAKQFVERKDFSEEANQSLKQYNLTMKISREKLLKQQLDLIVKDSSLNLQNKIEDKLSDAVNREVKRQAHILGEHVQIDDTEVKAVVNSNFKGAIWSTRLWNDMELVQKEVERVTSHIVIRGRHPNEFVSEFKKQTNSTTYNASRLLVTESARVQTESQKIAYLKDLGEDGEYKYVAKIDSKTSKLCHSLNGKTFKVKDMVPGVNAPPMHPWCRSTTVPHVGSWRDKFFKEREGKYQVENKESGKEKLQEKAKKEMLEMISNGKIKMQLNNEKQQRHILNTNEYNNKKNNSSFLPSYITIDSNEIEKMTKKEFIDFPVLFDDEGNFRKKQVIDYKKIIGKSYVNGKYIETKLGKVHYSKTGFHVVPYIKKE
ncbi:phage head morphogenesis protein [Staphylococcus schweitzeri]|uniref:Minor capsid protein n=1 Tax=Staphylococcus schweitzeri TaxID=1654388 RepID=A0A2K4ADZ2_9STAP|nr:minor capsid protein [Staphylococcus schweitzeri]MBE2128542.1 minor capsid protein [Staphylococcus schweitzeri]PNZ48305.1 phage head morphogenesis protein [Staphylococcus schweitzeri]CDR53606.1 phage Mu protein F like protein (pseudogene) [Staphylococcus schweitzeri]VEE65859.1 NAD+--asparagine ADP-ribosyltransferase [Staphylococcus schweitzeri]